MANNQKASKSSSAVQQNIKSIRIPVAKSAFDHSDLSPTAARRVCLKPRRGSFVVRAILDPPGMVESFRDILVEEVYEKGCSKISHQKCVGINTIR